MIDSRAVTWLDLWERMMSAAPSQRRRELIAATGASEVGALEIGSANRRLLQLHRSLFGSRIACLAECPTCDSELELDIDSDSLLVPEPSRAPQPLLLQVGEWEVSFRLPTEGDIEAARAENDLLAAESTLLHRCVESCRQCEETTTISLAPPEVRTLISARMEESDPLAIIDFELCCASCGHVWSSMLEPDVFIWMQLNAWANRMVRHVHTLATAYGWSELDIVRMSPMKRQLYLDLVAG